MFLTRNSQSVRACVVLALVAGWASFAAAQTADPDATFKKLDINEDGVLSGSEASTVKAFDTDGDGEVTRAEYDAAMKKQRPVSDAEAFEKAQSELAKLVLQRADALFKTLDGNADGWLSGTEIRPEHAVFDVDMNRRITKEEFEAGMLKSLGFAPADNVPEKPDAPVPPAPPADGKPVRTYLEDLGISFETPGKPTFEKQGIVSGYALSTDDGSRVYTVTWFELDKRFTEADAQSVFKQAQESMIGDGTKDPREEKGALGPNPGVGVLYTQKDGSVVWMRQIIVKRNLVQALAIAKSEKLVDRVAFERFLLSFRIDAELPKFIPSGPDKPRIDLIPPGADPKAMKVSHEAFVAALSKGDSKQMYAMMHPKLKEIVDRPIFEQFIAIVGVVMGAVDDVGLKNFTPNLRNENGTIVTNGKNRMEYAIGPVDVSTVITEGQITGFVIQSPEIQAQLPQLMLDRFNEMSFADSEKVARYYLPTAESFLRTLFDEGGDKALASLDPRVAEELKQKGEVDSLNDIRAKYGKITKIELETFAAEGPDDVGLKNFKLGLVVTRAEKGEAKVDIVLAVEGLHALIAGYAFSDDRPTASIPKRATLVAPAPPAPSAK